ncbi:MAG TPA: hypothetical protein ENN14_01130 [Chloroflexi bacterium]|nr:hypothetical protein [Chloroflexota bacterium]
MQTRRYIGKVEVQNVDGSDKVSGRAHYVADIHLPGMLHARMLPSPHPHARIARLDVTPALAVPGVHAAITQADFVNHGRFGWPVNDIFILAHEKVRYIGDPIAVVAAETPEAAQAGVEAIILELEPLPIISDPARARDPDAPLIPPEPPRGEGNLCERHILRHGDPAPLLETCAVLFEETYHLPHQEHAYLEPEAALAVPEPDGGVTIYSSNQSPFIAREIAASTLGLPLEQVRVIQPPVGGAFGGKDETLYQCSAQVAKLALLTGRPVRIVFTRTESMRTSYKRQAAAFRLRLGADAEGNLQAAQVHILADNGAYGAGTPLAMWRATMHAAGGYRYQAVHVDTDAVYTNNGYAGAFRGFGNTQATAAIEIAIDELAHRLDRDPLAYRLQNCLRQGDRTMTGDLLEDEVGLAACLEWVRARSEWDRRRAEYAAQPADAPTRKGLGVACYFHGSGLGGEGLDFAVSTLTIEEDNTITLTSGLTDFGQGSRTVFSIIAAEVLGVALERVRVLRPDTHTAIDSGPTVASRASIVGGNAVRVTAQKIAQLLDFAAADLLGCDPSQLVRDGEAYIGPTEEPHTFEEVVTHARRLGLQLSARGRWQAIPIEWDFEKGQGKPYFAYIFGAQVAEVEVNRSTGKTKVTRIWAAHDAGTILYPLGALGQIYGGIAQGLGYGLTESFRFVDSVPQALDLAHYRIPRAQDVPEIEATYIRTHLRQGPFGAKNLAEPVMMATAPAIVNAVFNATGVRFRTLPVDPARLKG